VRSRALAITAATVLSGDRGFGVIPREELSSSRTMQVRHPDVDQITIPK
jgi:hypothetical protein